MKRITFSTLVLLIVCSLANSAEWPTAGTTGWQHTGVTLTPYSGPTTITIDGTVINGKDIKSKIKIDANNVTIKRSRIYANTYYPLMIAKGKTGILIEDTEVSCKKNYNGITTSAGDEVTIRRVDVHDCENPLYIQKNGSSILVEDNFFHDYCVINPRVSHEDTIQTDSSNVTIRHNRLDGICRSAPVIGTSAITGGPGSSNVTIEDNLISGGGYSFRLAESGSFGDNVVIRNNQFSTADYEKGGAYGPFRLGDTPDLFCGNKWHDGPNAGQLISYGTNAACPDSEPKPQQPELIQLISASTHRCDSNNFAADHGVDHLWDGCLNNTPACSTGNQGQDYFWVDFDLGAEYQLAYARLFGDATGTWVSKNWMLQYKVSQCDDWTTAFSVVPAFKSGWVTEQLGIAGRYIRITVHGDPIARAVQADELEIYGFLSSTK